MRLKTHLSLLMINHNVVWLDVPMHYPFAVAEVKCLDISTVNHEYKPRVPYLQELVDVISHIIVDEFWIERPEICIVNILED